MPVRRWLLAIFCCCWCIGAPSVMGQETSSLPADLSVWQARGAVAVDESMAPPGSEGPSLKLSPGSWAFHRLRDADGSGTVELWVYDDLTVPADRKARRTGPRWGLVQKDGRVLVVGMMYAPYLAGDQFYTISETPNQKSWLATVQYSAIPRQKGWRKWRFDFDADKGLSISVDDGKAARFNWNVTNMRGFSGVILYGEESVNKLRRRHRRQKQPARQQEPQQPAGQTLWVAGVTATPGEPMRARPVPPPPPPPPPPSAPDEDPKLEGPPIELDAEVMAAHPRLLFSPGDLPRLRAFYRSDEAATFRESVEKIAAFAKPPAKPKFLRDATDGQRHGLWYMPSVAVHYAMTGNPRSLANGIAYLRFLYGLPNWETGKEPDSGMSAGNIMIGAALLFDVLHDELPADFREAFRAKLFYHARAMFHGGHLRKAQKIHYWQNDPQNNHRWHRNAGMVLAALAASNGAEEEQWLIRQVYDEMKFVNAWLPPDGTSHESISYLIFGASHLVLANHVADRCFGTDYLQAPFFRNVAPFMIQGIAPGLQTPFQYGDSSGLGHYGMFAFKTASDHDQPDVLAALHGLMAVRPGLFGYHWMTLLWLDPDVEIGSIENLPKTSFYPDLGIAFLRDGWRSDNVGAMFKCGPLGGYTLNEFRKAYADEQGMLRYINVAHDDPDANSFILWSDGAFLAETDRYSRHKRSANHNTILVNGMGQIVPGRKEDQVFAQPADPTHDMTTMAVVTAQKEAGDVFIIEGEAAGSYLAYTDKKTGASRPGLERFRRTFVWVRGGYLLVLDDIRAPEPVEITWLMQSPKLKAREEQGKEKLTFDLSHAAATCPMQIVPIGDDVDLDATIGTSPADDRSKPLNWQQLQLTSKTKSLRLATLLAPWDEKVRIAAVDEDKDAVTTTTIEIKGPGIDDRWTWTPADVDPAFTPSTVSLRRADGSTVGIGAGR